MFVSNKKYEDLKNHVGSFVHDLADLKRKIRESGLVVEKQRYWAGLSVEEVLNLQDMKNKIEMLYKHFGLEIKQIESSKVISKIKKEKKKKHA